MEDKKGEEKRQPRNIETDKKGNKECTGITQFSDVRKIFKAINLSKSLGGTRFFHDGKNSKEPEAGR